MQAFKKDQVIFLDGNPLRVVRQLNQNELQMEDTETGELSKHSIYSLMQSYVDGKLQTVAQRKHELRQGIVSKRKPARMDGMSTIARAETHKRIDMLTRLHNMGSFDKPKEGLREDLRMISVLRGDHRPVHESTVYRWRRRFLKAERDVRALFVEFDKQGGKGKPRLDPMIEAMIDEAVEEMVEAGKGTSATEVYSAVFLAVQIENAKRTESEHLKVPGLRTIQRRIADLYAFDLACARYGKKEAERRFAHYGKSRGVARVLEIVEIDHTPIDLLVVGDDRVTIGRPTLTVVLDRLSRCVLGYHLSLAGHGVPAVFSALRHAMLPKAYLKARYGGKLDWPCFGWPERILVDNGREFHADAVRDAMANLGVLVEYAGSRDPNDKPFVERFLRTFNYTFIHRLSGTTLSNVHERVGFNAEDEACLTLEELDHMVHNWICNVYHRRPHSGLYRRAPIDVWTEGANAHPPQLKMNRDDVDIEFSEVTESAVQHYGIDLNTFKYASPQLSLLGRMLKEKTKVTVKWPRHDVGFIWVWDAVNHEYINVPNQDPQFNGLTIDQAKAAKKRIAEGSPDYRRTNAEAKAVNSDIVSEALKDKKLKNRRKGARLGNQTSNAFRADASDSPQDAPTVAPADAAPTSPSVPAALVIVEIPSDAELEV